MKTKTQAPVEKLIAQLDEAGLERETGGFTLDRDKAREKMRQFQLADPHRYVLELVQAAVRKGATGIRFDVDADDMRMRFDGRPFTLEDFEHLYNTLLGRVELAEAEAVRQLALGLNAAMALNPRWIRVWSGNGGVGAHLEMKPGQEDRFEEAKGMADGTLIHVKGRFRPGLAVTFFQNLKGALPEEALLRERCGYSMVQIDLEGKILSRGLGLPGLVGQVPFEDGEVSGTLGWAPNDPKDATIHLVKDGVWISTHMKKGEAKCLVAVLDCPGFRKDVSQLDVVMDDTYKAAMSSLKKATSRSVSSIARELRESWDRGEKPTFPLFWGVQLCQGAMSHLSAESMRSTSEDSLGYHLARVPLWITLSGERVDSLRLLEELDQKGKVAFCTKAFDEHPEDPELSPAALAQGELILRPQGEIQIKILRALFGESFKKVNKLLEGRQEAVQNRRLWRLRPAKPRLEAVTEGDRFLATHTFEGATARGEVGIWRDSLLSSIFFFVVDGHALCRVEVQLPITGLILVLEAPFTPSARFDNVNRDDAYISALSDALDALPALFERLATGPKLTSDLEGLRRTALRAYVTALLSGDLAISFFDAMGIRGRRIPAAVKSRVAAWRQALLEKPESGLPATALHLFPMLPGLGDRSYSLAELRYRETRGEPIRYVGPELPQIPGRLDPVLRLTEEEVTGLRSLFGDGLMDVSSEHEAWMAEAEFMARPPEPVVLGGRDLAEGPWRVRFSGEGFEGEVALTYAQTLGAPPPWPVRFMRHERTLASRDVAFDTLSGAAVISSGALTPNEDWDDLVEDRGYLEALSSIHGAAFGLLGYLADNQKEISPLLRPSVTAQLLTALEAAIPTRSFGRALLALRKAMPQAEEADRAYQHLVDLLSSGELVLVDAAISDVLDAGEVPTLQAVTDRLIAGELQPARPPAMQLAMKGALDRFTGQPRPMDPSRCPFSALRKAQVFVDDDGNGCSIDDALADFDTRGQVLVLTEPGERAAVPDQRIFLLDPPQEAVLRHVFGHESLVDGAPFVEAALQRRRFEEQLAVERPTIPDTAVLEKRILGGPDRQGEVGLIAQPTGGSWLRVFVQGRQLCQIEKFSHLGILAAVNDDSLTPAEGFHDVVRDEAYAALVKACEAEVPAMLIGLAESFLEESFLELPPERRRPALQQVLAYLARPPIRHLARQAEDPDPVLARWLHLPVIEGPTGLFYSLQDLLKAREQHGELVYLSSVRQGTPRDPSRCLILAEGLLLKRLRALFEKVTSYERQWDRDQSLAALEAKGLRRLEDPDHIRALSRAPTVLGRLRGSLLLPESAEVPLVVHFGAFDLELFNVQTWGLYPAAGVFQIPEDQATGDLDASIFEKEIAAIHGEARGLYRTLAGRFPSFRDGSELKTRAREVLLGLLHRLLEARRTGQPCEPKDWKLLNQLTYLPLIEVDGEHINLDVARKTRPSSLAGRGYWEEEKLQGDLDRAGPQTSAVDRQPDGLTDSFEESGGHVPAGTQPRVEGSLLVEDSRAASGIAGLSLAESGALQSQEPPGAAAAPAAPATPGEAARQAKSESKGKREKEKEKEKEPEVPPEEWLIEALRTELRLIAAPKSAVLKHVDLRAIHPEKRKKDQPVSCQDSGIALHLGHPLVAAALRQGPKDPLLVTYLASALYTAVNLHLEEVTDEDEAQFQRLLLERVTSSIQRAQEERA
ncbi:MAG: hypothetical protein RBU30_05885 [Polyangia bacterium]|jgi:hypothetical protein|nr:hypothetical protein [Polyangia bacterium]